MPPLFRPAAVVRADLERAFPSLASVRWSAKSPYDDRYQCIAWAACRTDRKWWPVGDFPQPPSDAHWPLESLDASVGAFVQAFATLGYEPCEDASFEFGHQKVAIYANDDNMVTHMARQEFFGRGWLSKPGDLEDILHPDLENIEGDPSPISNEYGRVRQILKRSWWSAFIRLCLFRCSWAAFKFWLYRLAHNYEF